MMESTILIDSRGFAAECGLKASGRRNIGNKRGIKNEQKEDEKRTNLRSFEDDAGKKEKRKERDFTEASDRRRHPGGALRGGGVRDQFLCKSRRGGTHYVRGGFHKRSG